MLGCLTGSRETPVRQSGTGFNLHIIQNPGETMTKPTKPVFWEDFKIGETVAFGHKQVTREEIISFASEFDPQPFHLDEAAATETLLGGLAASGWHGCAMLMRLICDDYLSRVAGMGDAGVEDVRWLKPVRPGDVLTCRRTCLEARGSQSRPHMGIVKLHYAVENQHPEVAMNWVAVQMFKSCSTVDQGAGA